MALAISTNFAINANTALNAMNKSQSLMGKSISRISTGNRAANPADDPLSYFSGNKIKGDVDGYQALYNGVQDAAAQANVADSALSSIIDVLTAMKSQATAYDTTTDADTQKAISNAYKSLSSSLDSFLETQYKGSSVWNNSLSVQTALGSSEEDTVVNLENQKITIAAASQSSTAYNGSLTLSSGSNDKINFAGVKASAIADGDYAGTLVLDGSTSKFFSAYDDISDKLTFKLYKQDGSTKFDIKYAGTTVGTVTYTADGDNYKVSEVSFGSGAKSINMADDGSPSYSDIESALLAEMTTNKSIATAGKIDLTGTSFSITTTTANAITAGDKITSSDTNLKEIGLQVANNSGNTWDIVSSEDTSKKLGTLTTGVGAITKIEWEDESAWSAAGITKSSTSSSNTFSISGLSKPTSALSGLTGGATLSKGKADSIQDAIDAIAQQRTELGGSLSAMDAISSNLSSVSTATDAAYTAVTEANIAKEMTNYVRNNVYSQAAQAMISQANQSLAQVLNLLQ